MSQTQRHYGFAQVPRLVLRGDKFKDLTLIEKGLYASLKDICGDDGECFYTFRNLAKEIHTSISTLSRYIPKLVNAGLITAEKKIRSVNKHEVFHIRIVSIWEENDALYRPLDVKNGFTEKQIIVSDRNKSDVDTKIVSDRNNSVSDRNKNNGTQAQDCFYLNDRVISNNNLSEKESISVDASASRVLPQENNNDNHSHHIANGATPVAVVTTGNPSVQDTTPPPSQNTLLEFPLSEPDMRGKWNDEKVVQYAEWCHQKRYAEVMRNEQLKAASAIHAKDRNLTLEQYKQAHDRRFDAWWKEKKNGKLHVSDMKARGSSGIDRVHEMLEQIENQPKGQARPTGKTSSPSSSTPVKIDRKWLHENPV